MVLVLVACGTNNHKMHSLSANASKQDSIKIVEVKQDTTVNIEEPIKLRTLVCRFPSPKMEQTHKSKDSSQLTSTNKKSIYVGEGKYMEINVDPNYIYSVVEQMPLFPGGELELMKFVHNNLRQPSIDDGCQVMGKVICRFIIDIDGSVIQPEVIRSLTLTCDKEVIRVIKLLPKFIPGKQNGKNVRVWYTIPVTFKLE